MKLTKLQRHTAYLILLSEVEVLEEGKWNCYVCNIAKDVFKWHRHSENWIRSMIPEFFKHKPSENHHSGGWFDPEDYNIRKSILNQCIQKTY